MLFEDYKNEVLKSYQQKKNAGELSDNLSMPTPKKLRDECLMVLAGRYNRKDDEVIRLFFDPLNKYMDHAKSVERIDVGKFKPLINFVKGEINRTEDKNVKLLAWLIDFEPRPYKFIMPANAEEETKGEVTPLQKLTFTPIKPSNKKSIPKLFTILGVVILLLTTGGIYLIKYKFVGATYSGEEKCMYWAEDHYQPIACTQKVEDALVIALDTVRLVQFKKITRPDTISIKSVGKVYYFKHNGRLEFFTSGGFHPVYLDRKLKPLTAYMLGNYASQ